ncbi:hypothetical protein Tco_1203102 [Tanacetum coccineum]
MDATKGARVSCISPKSDSQPSRVFPESCTLLFMSNVAVETQESVVMLPEIASSMARLATSSKMARRTLRQVHLVTLTRKPDTSSRVFAITQNQTTNISEELPGISSIRDVEYDIELLPEQSLLQKLLIAYPHKVVLLGHVVPAEGIAMDPAKVEAVTKWPRPTSETEAHSFLKLAGHYHKVVEVFSLLALPLTKLTRKDEKLYGPKSERRSLKNQEIVRLHGTPSAIVSDKDPRFTFRILETHARQEGYTNKLSRPLKFTAKLSCFLESIAYEWRQTSHEYHSFHVISYPHDQIREDLSHLNEPESILNCQDIVMRNKTISFCQDFLEEPFFFSVNRNKQEYFHLLIPSLSVTAGHTKPRSFEKAVAPVDAENRISHIEKIFNMMDCNDVFKTRLAVYKFEGDALAWWKAYKQAKGGDAASENSTEYMQRFLRLAGFLGQAAGTAEEHAKNFRWGLHKSILDHVMCIQFTDVAQVADAARNLEILRDRDDYDRSERSDKRSEVQKNLYNALVEAYNTDKDTISTYGDVVTISRGHGDEDKDEEPSAGSN